MSRRDMAIAIMVLLLSGHAVDAARTKKTAIFADFFDENAGSFDGNAGSDHGLHATAPPPGDAEKAEFQSAIGELARMGDASEVSRNKDAGTAAFNALRTALQKLRVPDWKKEVMKDTLEQAPNVGKFLFEFAIIAHTQRNRIIEVYRKLAAAEHWQAQLVAADEVKDLLQQLPDKTALAFAAIPELKELMREEVKPLAPEVVPEVDVNGIAEATEEQLNAAAAQIDAGAGKLEEKADTDLREWIAKFDSKVAASTPAAASPAELLQKAIDDIYRINDPSVSAINMANNGEDAFNNLRTACLHALLMEKRSEGPGLLQQNSQHATVVWDFLINYLASHRTSRKRVCSDVVSNLMRESSWPDKLMLSPDLISQLNERLDKPMKDAWLAAAPTSHYKRLRLLMFGSTEEALVAESDLKEIEEIQEDAKRMGTIKLSLNPKGQVVLPPPEMAVKAVQRARQEADTMEEFLVGEIVQIMRSTPPRWEFAQVLAITPNKLPSQVLRLDGDQVGPTSEQLKSADALRQTIQKAFFEGEIVYVEAEGRMYLTRIGSADAGEWRVKYHKDKPSLRFSKTQSLAESPWEALRKAFWPGGDVVVWSGSTLQWLPGKIGRYLSGPGVQVHIQYKGYYESLRDVYYSDENAMKIMRQVKIIQGEGYTFKLGDAVSVWSGTTQKWCGGFVTELANSQMEVKFITSPSEEFQSESSKTWNMNEKDLAADASQKVKRERIPILPKGGATPVQGIKVFARYWEVGQSDARTFFKRTGIPKPWYDMAWAVASYTKSSFGEAEFLMMCRLVLHIQRTPNSIIQRDGSHVGRLAKRLDMYSRLENDAPLTLALS